MTKAIVCLLCVDVRMLRPNEMVACGCGNVSGRWIDARAGSCQIYAADLRGAALLGMSNAFLGPGLLRAREVADDYTVEAGQWWRDLHDQATKAPGYYFDESRRACWAILMGPSDMVSGVEWIQR